MVGLSMVCRFQMTVDASTFVTGLFNARGQNSSFMAQIFV
jgi:hypothetical protein